MIELFTRESHNVMLQALINNSCVWAVGERLADDDGIFIYGYLQDTPKTSLVAELVQELELLGYEITKKDNSTLSTGE